MGLSSNILWHQTSENGISAILESAQLRYAYSVETIISDAGLIKAAFPMVSVCDLPFSELDFFLNCEKSYGDNHFHNYGGYVIGFKREWGQRNGFTPVWYCDPHSDILNLIHQRWHNNEKEIFIYTLAGHIKNSEGELEKARADKYRFQDEREYRRLAPFSSLPKEKITLSPGDYKKYKATNGNSLLNSTIDGIKFTPDDIAYIIVPTDEDKTKLLSEYGHILGRTPVFTRDEVNANFIGIRHHHVIETEPEEKRVPDLQPLKPLRNIIVANSKEIERPTTIRNYFGGTQFTYFSPWAMPQYVKDRLTSQSPKDENNIEIGKEIMDTPNLSSIANNDTKTTDNIISEYLQKVEEDIRNNHDNPDLEE